MEEENVIRLFEQKQVRTHWDEEKELWYISVIDVIEVLTASIDPQAYWRKLKQRLKDEGNETVTNLHGLKMQAKDGKMRLTDVADTEQIFRLIQSVPSPKAEPFKLWLAQLASERLEEMQAPEITIDGALEQYLKLGYSENWNNQRLKSIEICKELTDQWKKGGLKEGVQFATLRIFMNKTSLIFNFCLIICLSAVGQTKNFIDQPYIEVGGYSDTLVTPNLIYIKIVIAEKDSRDKISLEEQENKMITSFKNLGLNTEVDLTTSDMLSNYKLYLVKQRDILKTKEYILKVTTAETASKVFMQLEDLGISNTSIHKVDHSDIENLKNISRTKAIGNSHKRAIALTKPISQTIGNAIHIIDNETNFDNQFQGRLAGVQIRGYSSPDKAKYEAPKIEFEKIKVSATVSVKYILK